MLLVGVCEVEAGVAVGTDGDVLPALRAAEVNGPELESGTGTETETGVGEETRKETIGAEGEREEDLGLQG